MMRLLSNSQIKQVAMTLLKGAGVYRPFAPEEVATASREPAGFGGEIPSMAGNLPSQFRLEFRQPRHPVEVSDLIYTPNGMAWVGGTLMEKYSLQGPSLKDAIARPSRSSAESIEQACAIQCETPATYGDWVSEYLCSLTSALPLKAPLLVPAPLANKSYVRRDLEKLGIETIEVRRPVLVRRATMIPKGRPSHYWTPAEVAAYRKAFRVDPTPPRPGSILYLSREGEMGEAIRRAYPSAAIAEVLAGLGARIVRARDTSQGEYEALASEAETVIADHGAAMCNLLLWQTRRVIELFSNHYWTSCFLFLIKGLGIEEYTLVKVDDLAKPDFERTIRQYLEAPIVH